MQAVDVWVVIRDFLIPVLAILVPTLIAVWLARSERRAAEHDRREEAALREAEDRRRFERENEERRLRASADVLTSLAHMVSISGTSEPMQDRLRMLRASIAVYRAAVGKDDTLSPDWLSLNHILLMKLWAGAMEAIDEMGGVNRISVEQAEELMHPPREHANNTLQRFSAWLSGAFSDDDLRNQGAEVLEQIGPVTDLEDLR